MAYFGVIFFADMGGGGGGSELFSLLTFSLLIRFPLLKLVRMSGFSSSFPSDFSVFEPFDKCSENIAIAGKIKMSQKFLTH